MKPTFWRGRLIFLALALALIAAACSSGNDEEVGGGDSEGGSTRTKMAFASPVDPTTLHPLLKDDLPERLVNDNIYDRLLTREATSGELQPGLATALPEAVDESTWRFTLREGVEFTNGEPFTADSVVASIEMVLDPDVGSEQTGFFTGITGAEKVDDYTVDIMSDGPNPVLPAQMAFMKMIPPDYSQTDEFAENPVGTGPYEFVSRSPGQEIVLTANENYWGEPPDVTDVTIKVIEDDAARLAALEAGEVQLVYQLAPEFSKSVPQFLTTEGFGAENMNVRLNNQEEGAITYDQRVRMALNLAVDKEALATEVFAGFGTPLKCQTVPPQTPGHNPDLEPIPYDPEQARALLEEAGVVGKTMSFYATPTTWPKHREVAELLAAYWEEVGLKVDLNVVDWDTYLDTIFAKSDKPDGMLHSSSNDLLDPSRQVDTYYSSASDLAAYQNDEVDQLAEDARKETDLDTRTSMYQDLLATACDDAAFVYLVNLSDLYGASEDLVWQPRGDQRVLFHEMSFE